MLANSTNTENIVFYICVAVVVIVWLIRNAYLATHEHKGPRWVWDKDEHEWDVTYKTQEKEDGTDSDKQQSSEQ